MKIVLLNKSFLSDKQIESLKKYGEVEVYAQTETEDELISRLKGAEVAVADCWDAPLSRRVFENSPSLKYMSINSTGYDLADVKAARDNDISVANVPGFSTDAVAEMTFGLMLATIRHIPIADEAMRQGPFQVDSANREYDIYLGQNLRGMTLGIIGLGRIGMRVAEIANGFGMKVIAYNRTKKETPGVEIVGLEDIYRRADVISLHTAYDESLVGLIDKEAFGLMKPTTVIVNTGRAAVINEDDFYEALTTGKIAGAGLDLINDWSAKNKLLKLDNVVFTPHSAFFTAESLQNMTRLIVENLESYFKGSPQNIIN
ncbi:MAG TPA: NAD(P)-dependent oxidoreductase [Candidatus Saccharimonadales bacterium]|nr:NAD(P)-dependent oxidoreductase [Candidatus Saccharimonadales bacterium]